MAAKGSYPNPSQKDCWQTCPGCFRCGNKGRYTKCNGCSGKHDPFGVTDVNNDDFCQCAEGVLRFTDKKGKLTIVKFKTHPFKGKVTMVNKTEDEEAWDDYIYTVREKLDDPTWDPIQIVDVPDNGSSFKYLGDNYAG